MKIAALFLILLVSCGQKSKLHFEVSETPIPNALKQSISYEQMYSEVLLNKCMGCHDEGGKTKLGTYAEAKAHLNGIRRTVVQEKTMPKAPVLPLTKAERQTVRAWVEAMGPEMSQDGSHAELPARAVLKPTYQSIKANIIDLKCIGCHTVGGRAAKYPMDTKADLMRADLKVVIAGNPDESLFLKSLEPDPVNGRYMPTKKSGFTQVRADQKLIIREWIMSGAN